MNNKNKSKREFSKRKSKLKNQGKKFNLEFKSNSQDHNTMDIDDEYNTKDLYMNSDNYNFDSNTFSENILKSSKNLEITEEFKNKVGKIWNKKEIFSQVYYNGSVEIIKGAVLGLKNTSIILSNSGNKINILDAETFELLEFESVNKMKSTFIAHQEEDIVTFFYLGSKRHLICSMENSLIRVFDLKNLTLHGNSCKIFKSIKLNKTICNKIVASSNQTFIALMLADRCIQIHNNDYTLLGIHKAHEMAINDIIFNPSTNSSILFSGSEDGLIKIWDVILSK